MWFIFQSSVIFAVVASDIHWHWTPNGYLASAIGIGLAYGLTLLLTDPAISLSVRIRNIWGK